MVMLWQIKNMMQAVSSREKGARDVDKQNIAHKFFYSQLRKRKSGRSGMRNVADKKDLCQPGQNSVTHAKSA